MLRAYVHKYTLGNVSAFGRCLGLPRHEILRWCSGATIPNLDQMSENLLFLGNTSCGFSPNENSASLS